MAEQVVRIYPNLPGVTVDYDYTIVPPTFDDSAPKYLIIGWTNKDSFADGTPVLFNEPYYIVAEEFLSAMFDEKDALGQYAQAVAKTSEWGLLPVVVRVGKKDIRAGISESGEPTLAPIDGNTQAIELTDKVRISWKTSEAPWEANFKLFINYVSTTKLLTVSINKPASENDEKLVYKLTVTQTDDTIVLKNYGLEIKVLAKDTSWSQVQAFQYGVAPVTTKDVYDALYEALVRLLGVEFLYIYAPDVKLENSTQAAPLVSLITQFAHVSSTQFKNCLAFAGNEHIYSATWRAMSEWVNTIREIMSGENGLYKDGIFVDAEFRDISQPGVGTKEAGHRIVIVPQHGYLPNVASSGLLDIAPVVGSYIHTNPVYTGPINYSMASIFEPYEKIQYKHADILSSARTTAITSSLGLNPNPTILVGKTAAKPGSPFTKLSSVLVVNEFVDRLRQIANQYLGKPNNSMTRMAMQSAMQNFANQMRAEGKFAGGTVTVEPVVLGGTISGINIKATINALSEVEQINIAVNFQYQG